MARMTILIRGECMTILYGLKNCDTCKKATKWLEQFPNGFPVPYDATKGLHLHNWLEAQVLRREAEALLGPR